MSDPLRTTYDFPLADLATDIGSRGRVFRSIPRGSRVLDVGCDTGRFGEILRREKSCEVHGIERDPGAAAEAAQRLNDVHVGAIDSAEALGRFKDFDVILFLDVLEHLYDPWSALKGTIGALRSGGIVIGVVPNIAHVSVVRRLLLGRFDYEEHGMMDRTHLRWFTRKSFARALSDTGFTDVTIDAVPVVPWIQPIRWIGQPASERLAHWFPDQFAGSLLGTGRRP
jgi:2-polyprenyl-3-methyl-5-hydroxy-6-metoxy-1,4-benzoquinol methylase